MDQNNLSQVFPNYKLQKLAFKVSANNNIASHAFSPWDNMAQIVLEFLISVGLRIA
jgi:hypothetical protein